MADIQEVIYQVGEAWQGAYNSATSYGAAAVVQDTDGLSIYRSLKDGNAGHALTDTAWWMKIIDFGTIKEASDTVDALNGSVAAAETARQEAEASRVSSETARRTAETARISAEQTRADSETARIQNETTRSNAETLRAQAESERQGNESARQRNEIARRESETSRQNAEAQRQTAENNRASAEQTRIDAENNRQQAEASRENRASTDHTTAVSDHATMDAYHTRADNDHTTATADHSTATADHSTATGDHTTAQADHTTATADHTAATAATTAANSAADSANAAAANANDWQEKLESGEVVPAMAENLESWADRDALSVEDTWTGGVRTTAGDTSIVSDNGGRIVSIVAKEDFSATQLRATGFNLLHGATVVGGAYCFLVPALTFGSFGTAEKPNGVLFTNAAGENLKPTVRFKALTAGAPASASDGAACAYTDSNGYRFFTTTEAGYLIVSGITLAETCAHIAWSRRYDEFVSPSDSDDAGSAIALSAIISACHDFGQLLTVGSGGGIVADSISFGDTAATWTRRVQRTKPTWTTVADEVGEGGTQTYTHTADISDMKPGGIAQLGSTELTVDGTTVSYSDTSSEASADYVKYELATAVTGTVSVTPTYALEDWGLELIDGIAGDAYVTTQYAQGYPDSVAALASSIASYQLQVLTEAVATLRADFDGMREALSGGLLGTLTCQTVNAQEGYQLMGQPLLTLGEGAPTAYPMTAGQLYFDTASRILYIATTVTMSLSDWKQVA